MTTAHADRRRVLRGLLGGAAITVGLPILDGMLNENGTAFAATGAPIPARFGTWFWGCGLNAGRWEPNKVGTGYDLGAELAPLERFKSKINLFSGFKAFLDGKPNGVHFSGAQAVFTGTVPRGMTGAAPSVDQLVADVIGSTTRFRSLEAACMGIQTHSQSRRGGSVLNPAETSPTALYARIFGADFSDPNAAEFKPDPKTLIRQSALSVVAEERAAFMRKVGVADRVRLDEYFTSLRDLEQQLSLQLAKPAPLEACTVPASVAATLPGTEIEVVKNNHTLFAKLLAHALACGQTRVVNVAFSDATSSLRKAGGTSSHHEYTHDEPVDRVLGYQTEVTWFNDQIMQSFALMLTELDRIREGAGTLLDNTLIFASTDTGLAKLHSLENIPIITAGSASGRFKTGMHVRAVGDTVARVGLTVQQALGVPVNAWGTESQETSKTITEILA